MWVLIGTLIIFSITTVLAGAGLGERLGEDPDVLFVVQVASAIAAIVSAGGLLMGRPRRTKN